MNSHEPSTLVRQGIRLVKIGEYQAAVEKFTAAISLDPDLRPAYRARAGVLRRLGRFADAQQDFDAADLIARGKSATASAMDDQDPMLFHLQSLGVNAQRGVGEIAIVDDGPIDSVEVQEVITVIYNESTSTDYYTFYSFKIAYGKPNATIKSVRRKNFPLVGKVIDADWRVDGSDRRSALVADVLQRLREDAQIREAIMATRDVQISCSGSIRTATRDVPTRQAWDCYQAIAQHLIDAGREEPNTL